MFSFAHRYSRKARSIGVTYRQYSNSEALDKWISQSSKQLVLSDAFHFEHLSKLYITLPTRDGTRKAYQPPVISSPLGYGHHLAFFHERVPESRLREDGTEDTFCPPNPFTRRMWAGGRMTWYNDNPLVVGHKASASSAVAMIEKKGFDTPHRTPMIFVSQKIDFTMEGKKDPSVVEERSHVYLSNNADVDRGIRAVTDVPTSSDFFFQYTPSLTTLFRFSALTFNAHHIHLDREYSQRLQGYPERLVHGPLTALMLLETAIFHNPGLQLRSFEYRARNPMVVKRAMTIHGSWTDKNNIKLWCMDENGAVGMTGTVETDRHRV